MRPILGCATLCPAVVIANQEYLHLITLSVHVPAPNGQEALFQEMIEFAFIGAAFVASGCGLIFLGARERKELEPIAIE